MAEFSPWIAVVDDDVSVRRALLRLLRSADMHGRAFGSGAEFLDFIKSSEPDCVLLDLHMPETSGFEVQSRLALGTPDMPVIIMTGQDSPEIGRRVMLYEPLAYLLKPVNDQALLDAIKLGLRRSATKSQVPAKHEKNDLSNL